MKLIFVTLEILSVAGFLSYYPLKQGLKPEKQCCSKYNWKGFLSYYPLKQGLKLNGL